MNKMYLVLGDWSDDGHGKSQKVLIKCNKTVEEIQQGYKDSCKLTGVSFNDYCCGDNYTGLSRKDESKYQVCCEYEDGYLSKQVIEIFESLNCPRELLGNKKEKDEEYSEYVCMVDTEIFTKVWLWFVKLSIPDLEYNLNKKDEIPYINGYYNKALNSGFGYGIF